MSDQAKDENLPDPLENLQKIFGLILAILYEFFTKVVPVVGIGLIGLFLLLYLFFKLFGLV